MKNKSQPLISVIIPSYNEEEYIARLLSALANQSYSNFEVVVSDGHSSDTTVKQVNKFKQKLQIKIIQSPAAGPGAQRNIGAKSAGGDWLLFLDADIDIDDPAFIEIMLSQTLKSQWKVSTAKFSVKGATPIEQFGTWFDYHYIKFLRHTKHPVAPGWCILTRREIFETNLGFNEKIQFGEDYDLVSRISRYGFGFVVQAIYYIDLRRVREEGFNYIYKGIANEVYRHSHHYNLEANRYGYDFGKHGSKKNE